MTDWETCPAVESRARQGERHLHLHRNKGAGFGPIREPSERSHGRRVPGLGSQVSRSGRYVLFSTMRPRPSERPPSREDPVRSGHASASATAPWRPHSRYRGGAGVVRVEQWRPDREGRGRGLRHRRYHRSEHALPAKTSAGAGWQSWCCCLQHGPTYACGLRRFVRPSARSVPASSGKSRFPARAHLPICRTSLRGYSRWSGDP